MKLPFHVGFNTIGPLPCRGQAGKRLTDEGVAFLPDLDVKFARYFLMVAISGASLCSDCEH